MEKLVRIALLFTVLGMVASQMGLQLPAVVLWLLLGGGATLWCWSVWRDKREADQQW